MSIKIRLSLEETYLLADHMQQTKNKKLSRRLLAVSLRHFGYQIQEISPIVGVHERTVTKWLKLFVSGGFDALLEMNYQDERGSRLQAHQEAIRAFWVAHPDAKLQDLQAWLASEHGVKIEYSWLYRYLEKRGLLHPDSQ